MFLSENLIKCGNINNHQGVVHMKSAHHLLLTPGPTPVPDEIRHAIQQPMIGHRSKAFEDVAQQAFRNLKLVFGTENNVAVLTSSGTSALEAAMVNMVNPQDHIAIIVSGAFGQRFEQIAKTYYEHVHTYHVPWGEAVDVDDFIHFLTTLDTRVQAVFSQYCETSTAVLHPVHELGHALHQLDQSIYFIVDGVSCIGAVDANMARDYIDVLVSGSQKALMLPPGLAFVAYNDRAAQRFAEVTTPRFYLDLNKYLKSMHNNSTPFTPNVSLFQGINAYYTYVINEGWANVRQRHETIRNALRQALEALELPCLVSEAHASPTVTAFVPKTKEEVQQIKAQLSDRFNITIAGGQGKLKGEILRIGHMGHIQPFDILSVVAALEIILSELRNTHYIGIGTKAYLEVIKHAV